MGLFEKNAVNELLNHSIVMTIDEKRYERFNRFFAYHDLLPLPFKIWGSEDKTKTPKFNCYMAHRSAVMRAKELDWPFVCVFEDDAYPVNNVRAEMESMLKNIPQNCQVFQLAWLTFSPDKYTDLNKDFFSPYVSWGGHAYIVLKQAYDNYVNVLDQYKEGDGVFFSREDHDILRKNTIVAPKKRLFLQYTGDEGSVNHGPGYYLGKPFEKGCFSDAEIFNMGFPKIQDVLKEG